MPKPLAEVDQSTFVGRCAARIRARRLKIKLEATAAAELAGASLPGWYKWETGQRLPLDALPRIAKALRCKVRDLIPPE